MSYEFAPSRGQIHAHILAITDNKWIQKEMFRWRHDNAKQAKVLSQWASKKFNLSAQQSCNVQVSEDRTKHPCSYYFSDNKTSPIEDANQLKECVGIHKCSNGYCLRDTTAEEKKEWCKVHGYDPTR